MTTQTIAKPLTYLEMKSQLNKIGKKGDAPYYIKWEDINLDFRDNIRVDYGVDLSRFDTMAIMQESPIIGFIDSESKFNPRDGFSRLAWYKQQIELGNPINDILISLNYDSSTIDGGIKLMLNSANSKPLSLVEQGRGYQRLRDECNLSLLEISESVCKSTAHIGQCLKLLDNASEEVLELIEEGSISSSAVIKLHQTLTPEEAKTMVLEAVDLAKEQGKTKATAKTIKEVREKKAKLEDQPSQLSNEDGDEFAEHKSIAQLFGNMSSEDWEELDLGPLRKILAMVNK